MTTSILTARRAGYALLAAALLLGVMLIQLSGGADAAEGEKSPPEVFTVNAADARDASTIFAALRRESTAADRDNAAITFLAQHQPWLRVAGSRKIGASSLGNVWLSPTSDGRACLTVDLEAGAASGPVQTCDTVQRAATIGIVLETEGRFLGVAPDGTTSVTLTGSSGATEQLAKGANQVFDTASRRGHISVTGPKDTYGFDVNAMSRPGLGG